MEATNGIIQLEKLRARRFRPFENLRTLACFHGANPFRPPEPQTRADLPNLKSNPARTRFSKEPLP